MNILDHIFPKECILCSRLGFDICDSCLKKIPHTVPSCCICNRVNSNYLTHDRCSCVKIQFFTGWCLTKDIESEVLKRTDAQIYSIFKYLLLVLIDYLSIEDIVANSNIIPIKTNNKNDYLLNIYLSNILSKGKDRNNKPLFIGWNSSNWNQKSIEENREPYSMELPTVRVLSIFKPTEHRG